MEKWFVCEKIIFFELLSQGLEMLNKYLGIYHLSPLFFGKMTFMYISNFVNSLGTPKWVCVSNILEIDEL